MGDEDENVIHVEASRARLRRLAKQKWGDMPPTQLAAKLAGMLMKEYPANTLSDGPRGTHLKPALAKSQFAVIDTLSDQGTVFGGFDSPELMDEDAANQYAREKYPDDKFDDSYRRKVVIKWNATEVQFRSSGRAFPLDNSMSDSEFAQAIQADQDAHSKSTTDLERRIELILKDDVPEGEIRRSLNTGLGGIIEERDRVRARQIRDRRNWIEDKERIVSDVYRINENLTSKSPGGLNPGIVALQSSIDHQLVSVLLSLFSSDPPIAVALCKSQMWMHENLSGWTRERKSLLSDPEIGVPEGSSLPAVVEKMVSHQFSVQPIFSKEGEHLGSLELKTLTAFVTRNGLSALPKEIDVPQLRSEEYGLLGWELPKIPPQTTVDNVSVYLGIGMSTDAVLFEWNGEEHSGMLPDDCRGILEDGIHIVTSHDLVAYQMWEEIN